jgi:glycosyltransferase involved in cell wall biosynthesis
VGGIRAINMAKALTHRGWDVTVVSPRVSVWRSVEREEEVSRELDDAAIRCIRTEHQRRNLSPYDLACRDGHIAWIWGGVCRRTARFLGVEHQIGWVREASRACAGLNAEDVDLVLATGPPFVGFRLAAQIAERLRRPYVLDYRDLWTHNPHAKRLPRASANSAEGLLIARAAEVTVVSPLLAVSLCENFNVTGKVHVITNGYDAADLADVKPRDFGHFAITYTGQFYPPKRIIDPLLAVLARLKARGGLRREWRFHYFGPHGDHVRAAMKSPDLESHVLIHGNVPRRQAVEAVAGAGVSIVITSVHEKGSLEDLGVVTGKVFEAIGLKTPVLAIAPQGSDLESILKTSGLGARFSGGEVEAMSNFLAELVNGRPLVPRMPEAYSWEAIGESIHSVLQRVVVEESLLQTSEISSPMEPLLRSD